MVMLVKGSHLVFSLQTHQRNTSTARLTLECIMTTNQEILVKLREAEGLVIQVLRIMYEVRLATSTSTNQDLRILRRDQHSCAEICPSLFRLVEPSQIEAPEDLTPEKLETTEDAPRGV